MKPTSYALDVADGIIGLAQGLEALAKNLRRDATLVRQGQYLPDFAVAMARNTKYRVDDLLDTELPETTYGFDYNRTP